jgi:hypothetical protein
VQEASDSPSTRPGDAPYDARPLLEKNPFAEQRPQYIRAQFYDYTFAGDEEKSQGLWWRRRAVGLYFPVVRLKVK